MATSSKRPAAGPGRRSAASTLLKTVPQTAGFTAKRENLVEKVGAAGAAASVGAAARAADRLHLWHPFTAMDRWGREEATVIVGGEGFELIDAEGRRYLDGFSSLWCNLFGHRVAAIDAAVRSQLGRIAHTTQLGLANDVTAQLASRLCGLAPRGLTRAFFSDSGSEAVEVALKMAYQYWRIQPGVSARRRNLFLRLGEAYHGDTLGSVSVGGIGLFHATYRDLVFKTVELPAPHALRRGTGQSRTAFARQWRAAAAALFQRVGSRLAAVVVEPCVQGAAGMIVHPPGTLRFLADLARQHGTLLICDEVATGFARTGKLFAVEHESVRPDFLCVAKGLTGGYLPVSATLSTESIFNAFADRGAVFYHGHTYSGNPLGCAAALATLDLIERRHLVRHVQEMAPFFKRSLAPLSRHPHVAEVRLKGLMGCIELTQDRRTLQPFPVEARVSARVCQVCRREGVMLRPLGDTVPLMPIPAMGRRELKRIAEVVIAAVVEVTGQR
ncbi:MAG: adenosylmethionine--8-amino-7-oxononanoate transaminase [Planctomycetota bacterium]